MEISLEVFGNVMLDEQPEETTCRLLFLNKYDLFKEKLQSKKGLNEFNEKFPDFNYLETGYFSEFSEIEKKEYESLGEKEKIYRSALKYIENKFRSTVLVDPENQAQALLSQSLIVKYTCAVDTDQIGSVFDAIKDKIFLSRMMKSGIRF